jgi:hypothetical protein
MDCGNIESADLSRALQDKLAVGVVTRLRSAADKNKPFQEESGLGKRLMEGLSGKSRERQGQINADLQAGLEYSVEWLTELTSSVELGHRATLRVWSEVEYLQENVSILASATEGLQDSVAALDERLNAIDGHLTSRISKLEGKVNEIDFRARAHKQVDRMFERWTGNALDGFSLAQKTYLALEQMWWGDVGYYCYNYPGREADEMLIDVRHRLMGWICEMAGIERSGRFEREYWFDANPKGAISADLPLAEADVVEFFSDWADSVAAPFSYASAHYPENNDRIYRLPYLFSAERMVSGMQNELFNKEVV